MVKIKTGEPKIGLPTILVILGATGDLFQRKLIRAIFNLYSKNLLPPLFQIVGFSRRKFSDKEFRHFTAKILKDVKPSALTKFLKLLVYRHGFFEEKEGYLRLHEFLGFRDKEWRVCSNKLFYLAVPPKFYKTIFVNLAESHLTDPCGPEEGWTRVIVEKPFGKDLKTAKELDALLGKLFKEEQIYRIDHYLGKETVQNILAFRFSNNIFDYALNYKSVERIEIKLFEREGVEGRGSFYDDIGALRDVGQNHLLQLLALFTMDTPVRFEAREVRDKRASLLMKLAIPNKKYIKKNTYRAQYDAYHKIKGVNRHSSTETYFKVKTYLEDSRWRGVPIYLEGGKCLPETLTEVMVIFRHPIPCLCPEPEFHYQNVLHYKIKPDEGIKISLWVKKPGPLMALEEHNIVFSYPLSHKESFFEDYEKLCLDAILGNQMLFVSTKEIMASWRFIDPIVHSWQANEVPLLKYKCGSYPLC